MLNTSQFLVLNIGWPIRFSASILPLNVHKASLEAETMKLKRNFSEISEHSLERRTRQDDPYSSNFYSFQGVFKSTDLPRFLLQRIEAWCIARA